MNKKILSFLSALSLVCMLCQISYADTKKILVPEYGTGINRSWDDRFCVGIVKIEKNGSSLGETQMKVLGSRNTYREKGSLLIKLLLENLNIDSEISPKNIIENTYSEFSIHAVLTAEGSDEPIIFKTSTFRYERSKLYINATMTINDDVYSIKGTLSHNSNARE